MKKILQNKYLLDFFAAMMFFTRIPVNWSCFSKKPPNLARAAWCFPLIGYIIGVLSGSIGEICILINLPIFLSCMIAVAFSIILTGALHEDGLADMADGFGARGSPEKINKIMHDSRLGAYGTTALILGLSIRMGLITSLVELGYSMILILSTGFATGKIVIIFMRNFYDSSKFSKTGSIIERVSKIRIFIATLLWIIPIYFFFPLLGICFGIFLVIGLVLLLGRMSKQKLGGITGDVLGATAILTELVFLFGITVYLGVYF